MKHQKKDYLLIYVFRLIHILLAIVVFVPIVLPSFTLTGFFKLYALLKNTCQAFVRQSSGSYTPVLMHARLLQGSRNAVAKQSQGSHELGSWKYSIYLNKRLIIVKQSFKLSLQYEIMYASFIVSPMGLKVFSVLFQSIFLAYLSLQSTKNISE